MVSIRARRACGTPPVRKFSRGFTLIELLVVLAILTLLDLDKSLELFKLDVGRYPTTEEGLDALVKRPGSVNGWAGPYLKGGVPTDPWGRPYRYASPGPNGGIEILSLGADSAPGGEGENADVRNTP